MKRNSHRSLVLTASVLCSSILWAADLGDPHVKIEGELLIEADEGSATTDVVDNGLSIMYLNSESSAPPATPTARFLVTENHVDWVWGMNGDVSPIWQMALSSDNTLNLYDALNNSDPVIQLNPSLSRITIGDHAVLTDAPGAVLTDLNELEVSSGDPDKPLLSAKDTTVDVEGRLRVGGIDVLTYMDYVGQDENLIFNSDLAADEIVNFYEKDGAPLTKISRITDGQVHPIFENFSRYYPDARNVQSAVMVEGNVKRTLKLKQNILINPEKRYRVSGYIKHENLPADGTVTRHVAMQCFDRDMNPIIIYHVKYAPESVAQLAHPFDPAVDTSIYIDQNWGGDLSHWPQVANTDARGLVFWAYQDYHYVDGKGSYSRYSQGSYGDSSNWIWDPVDVVYHPDGAYAGSYEVPLLSKLYRPRFTPAGVIPAGTKVGASVTGGNNIYIDPESGSHDTWRRFEGIVGGGFAEPTSTTGTKFFPATKFIQLNVLHNWLATPENGVGGPIRTYIAGFSCEPLEDEITDFEEDISFAGDITVTGNVKLTTVPGDISMGGFTAE